MSTALPDGVVARALLRVRDGQSTRVDDAIAEEVPVALVFDGDPFAVMLASPVQLEDFAVGFALTEGIIETAGDLAIESIEPRLEGIELRATLPARLRARLAGRQRSLPGRSGCGLCGATALEHAVLSPPPVADAPAIRASALHRALAALPARQDMNRATGAVHAAAFADREGGLRIVREDIGRHNALDKLAGAMAREGVDPASGFAIVTSRASSEMATKAAAAGIGLLAAVSAPTALAVSLAQRCNLALVGFARPDGHALYSHPQRLIEDLA